MMKYAAVAAACLGMAVAPINEYVVRTSVPEQVDASLIAFTGVTHRDATIAWSEPGLGDWQWPVLGYEIQVSTAMTWSEPATPASTDSYALSDDSAVLYDYAVDWSACPQGESGALDTMGVANTSPWDGAAACTLNGVTTATTAEGSSSITTSHAIPGLASDTVYYFRIRARNHDGMGAWSEPSYGLLTHSIPETPEAPVVKSVTEGSVSILFNTPATTGSSDCGTDATITAQIAAKAGQDVTAYLAAQACTSLASDSAPRVGDEASDCMSTDAVAASAPCQTIGAGSAVTSYRILMCEGSGCTQYTELKATDTGLSLYPMTAGAATTDLLDTSTDAGFALGYTITGLSASTVYSVVVKATNAAGESAASPAVEGTTLGIPNTPEPPTATEVGETTVTLTWDTGVANCVFDSTVPLSTPGYLSLTGDFPNTPTLTTACDLDNNVDLTGFRLFASSYNVLGETTGGAWEPARRGSLSTDSGSTSYFSSPMDTALPTGADDGSWLEVNVADFSGDVSKGSFVVEHLSQDTYYKFKILFANAVGDSAVSVDSEYFLTMEAPVSDLKMHSSPPCIYEDGGVTQFVATSTGTNVFYKWQLPDGMQTNSHDTRSFGSVIAEGGAGTDSTRCQTSDCSVMEFVVPSVAPSGGTASTDDFTLALVGYNTRGQVTVSTTYDIQYCGCTDPWDPAYWDQATYHMPAMCAHESWDGADMTVIEGEFQYYQTFYEENTHSGQVIVRVDEGSVDLYASTEKVPDPDMSSTYFASEIAIVNFKVLEIDYSDLAGTSANSLYLAIQGSSGAAFSRFSVISSTREFTRGRGERYNDATVDGSTGLRRTQLLNIEPQAFEVKTPYYDFFEYYFGRAENDMDVEIKVNCQLGCVNVYTSKIERFPSALRATDTYAGYWTSHNGNICASAGTSTAAYATASFDGNNGIYGMVSFEQACLEEDEDGVCTTTSPTLVSVSLKGIDAAATWEITDQATGDTTATCGGASYASLPANGVPTAGDDDVPTAPTTIYTKTVSTTDSLVTLFGSSLAGETSSQTSVDGTVTPGTAAMLGRSVTITIGSTVVCATIFPDATVTSLVGELSLMHTIRPEETIETCMTADGTAGDCAGAGMVSAERLLFASVQGAQSFAVGDEQVNNEYTIEAKIYRYRVESNLLEPTVAAVTDNSGEVTGYTSVADMEDRRYSVVSIDNFNYYEVELSPAAYGLTLELTLAYGSVEIYTSQHKLPTQDVSGYDNLFGDVHGQTACPTVCTKLVDGQPQDALAAGETLTPGTTYSISIPWSAINVVGKYVFIGVLGVSPDSSYTIKVTEYLFSDTMGTSLTDGAEIVADVPANKYVFFTLYVGPTDDAMYVTERSHAGHRTGDLGTDPDTWGIDWNEPLVQTWIEQQQDEWDLDVDVSIDLGSSGLTAFGSSREAYPSLERGYDVKTTDGDSSLTIPHFTFSDKTVFISLYNPTDTDAQVTFTPRVLEMHTGHLTADTPTVPTTCLNDCSGHGSCVDTKCYCDNGFLGEDCAIEAFSSAATGQPSVSIADMNGSPYPGTDEVTVPFTLATLPPRSKVHVYVDGLPYPAKGANVLYYTAGGNPTGQEVKVFGMAAGVLHTVELLLLSEENIPLGTDMVDFTVNFAGGCSNGCSDHGVCHHGYCVCFDGYTGDDCGHTGEDPPNNFVPGAGFVTYNTELMQQERDEDAYISTLKLTANEAFLAISDAKIADAHAAVVTKLNDFVIANEADMATLAVDQANKAKALHRKRDRITTTIQQMREESKRLKTANTEAYLETVRALHEGQRQMQNELDSKRLEHFRNMAVRHDEWVEIKEKNDFKLNQLRTANGPLVDIDDLQERECTVDDMFHTSCTDVDASTAFVEEPGYTSHGTVGSVGICTDAEAAAARDPTTSDESRGFRCVCPEGDGDCVKVEVDGEMDATLYHNIPR